MASTSPETPSGRAPRGTFLAFLVATALLCGALVMVIEVLGSRVIGPYFGVSLFVWTSLITVTLVGLAAGYAVGGWLSDRRPDADWLYGIVFAAGAAVLLLPYVKEPVLRGSLSLGLRAGALASAAAIFFPSLFLLGCVSPYIVKIAAKEIRSIGRVVGALYAVSTVGSFVGTVLTGFVLIAAFGVDRIFQVVGVLLLALGGLYFALFRGRWWIAAPAVLALALPQQARLRSGTLPGGMRVTEVYRADTFYGRIDVVDLAFDEATTRELIIDGAVQGGMDLETGLSTYPYAHVLGVLPRALHPDGRRCLVVGVGAGLVPAWYERQGVATDVVEIDPQVLEVARRHFGLAVSGRVVLDDARHFLNVNRETYDYVLLDAFSGDTMPGHLLTREALALAAAFLAPRGILAVNLVAGLGPEDRVAASVARTLSTLFDQVEVRPLFEPGRRPFGSVEIVAYRGPRRALDREAVERFPVHPAAAWALPFLWTTHDWPRIGGVTLTDDHNPMEVMDLSVKEAVRRSIASARRDWDLGSMPR